MSGRMILSEKLEDNQAAAEWGREQAERMRKGEEITQKLIKKYTLMILSHNEQNPTEAKR